MLREQAALEAKGVPAFEVEPDVRHIKVLYSHPQAWGQCDGFLGRYLKGVERRDVGSTSRAAELVKGDESGESAAIAGELAGEVFGLDVVTGEIQDLGDNTTRFFVLRNVEGRAGAEEDDGGEGGGEKGVEGADWKTLISFTIDHASPGALAEALMVFKKHGLNLTSINSRPSRQTPWHYIFFVECKGKMDDRDRREGKGAARDLDQATTAWRWLGSWKDQLSIQKKQIENENP